MKKHHSLLLCIGFLICITCQLQAQLKPEVKEPKIARTSPCGSDELMRLGLQSDPGLL